MTVRPALEPQRVVPPGPECWRRVGTFGDRTCPELARFVHCRNCPVIADAARRFFERPAPPGYRESWQEILAQPVEAAEAAEASVLVFRVGSEWLALPTTALLEVATPRPIHPLPHRTGTPLLGIVNIRGHLQLACGLEALLDLPPRAADRSDTARLLLIARPKAQASTCWALAVDEVASIHRVALAGLKPPPATVRASALQATQALFDWAGRRVGLLDLERLLDGLEPLASGATVSEQEPPPWKT
jgi:chemotaxis-related protein WspD